MVEEPRNASLTCLFYRWEWPPGSTRSLGTHAKAHIPSSSSQDGPKLLDKDTGTARSSWQLLPNKRDGLPVAHTPVSQLPVSRCGPFLCCIPKPPE